MFKGTYRHRIDPKGRLPVPAAFRRALAEEGAREIVVTLFDQCLAGYAPGEWARLEQQLAALPTFSRPAKSLTRVLTSQAADCEMDVQGRVLLPAPLRRAAHLDREAVVVGVLNRFEIWAPKRWDVFLQESESLLEDISLDVQWPPPPAGSPRPVLPQAKPKR